MPTMKDVAQYAGVSAATVSNVLNNSAHVKDKTRARVLQAIADLEYDASVTDKDSSGKKGGVIGVVLEEASMFNTPEIYSSICETCSAVGYNVIACNLALTHSKKTSVVDEVMYREAAQHAINLLLSKNVEAIIYVGCQCREIKYVTEGYEDETPFVFVYCYSNDQKIISIVYNDEESVYNLISYLIRCGHQKIGVIAGPQSSEHVRMRLSGYQRALFDNKILFNPNLILFGDWENEDFGRECCPALLSNGVSAIFCMNDMLAVGVIDYMHEHQIKVPEQLSVTGFDNIPASHSYYPKLTTVELPLAEMGHQAAFKAVKLISTPKDARKRQVISLPCNIIYRDSVSNIAK